MCKAPVHCAREKGLNVTSREVDIHFSLVKRVVQGEARDGVNAGEAEIVQKRPFPEGGFSLP